MTLLTMQAYAGEADLPRMVDLFNACEAVDQIDQGISLSEMREELDDPTLDLQRGLGLWEDAEGNLVAIGLLTIPTTGELSGFLRFRIHPAARWEYGLEGEIFGWATDRVREVAQQRGESATLRTGSVDGHPRRMAMLEQHGFKPVRYFIDMARPLDEDLLSPQLPPGFTLRHLSGPDEVPAWVELFNLSFIDHWDHHPLTVEERLHWLTESDYRPEQDLIVVAPDGTFAAFCKCRVNPEQNRRTGRQEGWISLLGTRRGYRKMGLGRAMVLAGLHRLKADGLDVALLGVDADSPTGATRLYESLGFQMQRRFVAFIKDV